MVIFSSCTLGEGTAYRRYERAGSEALFSLQGLEMLSARGSGR